MQNSVAKKIFAVGSAVAMTLAMAAPFAAHAAVHAAGTNVVELLRNCLDDYAKWQPTGLHFRRRVPFLWLQFLEPGSRRQR